LAGDGREPFLGCEGERIVLDRTSSYFGLLRFQKWPGEAQYQLGDHRSDIDQQENSRFLRNSILLAKHTALYMNEVLNGDGGVEHWGLGHDGQKC
jgi:hypothetical protein